MNGNIPLEEFLNLPTTVDFIIRQSVALATYAQNNPDIIKVKELMGTYALVYVNRADISIVENFLGASILPAAPYVLGLLDLETLQQSGIFQVQQQPYLDLKGRGVLIGIVDTGIDYTKDTFIYEDGTSKIQFIYDQTVKKLLPELQFLGEEYTNAQINEALKAENPYDIVPQRDTVGHGTFLASIAAGRKDQSGYIGAAPDAELIVVKLRKARQYYLERYLVPPEQENAFESSAVMVGIEYIIRKARELGKPVVICLGVGTNTGGHDGLGILEEFLSQMAILSGVCICAAAGNESQARHHFQGKLTFNNEEQSIDIRVSENMGSVYIAILSEPSDRLSVSIRSPTGELVGRIPARSGLIVETGFVLEKARVAVEYYFPLEVSGAQATIVRLINATPGIWSIIVHGDIVLDGTYHAWLPITGLVSPGIEFLNPSPYFTVVVPATAVGVITCGAYNSDTGSLYIYSSWGPTRALLQVPDLVAPGVNVGGVYPTGYGTMDGTSVSAAVTAGASALLMQWGVVDKNDVSMNTYGVRAYLIRGCNRGETLQYPNPQWGYGSLNLMESFNVMRRV